MKAADLMNKVCNI